MWLAALGLAASASPAFALEPDVLFDKVSPSVWSVITQDAQGRPLAGGSAVVIGAGRLVTNCHVLAKASSFSVKRENVSYGATLEYPDPERDLCQIKVSNFTAPAVEMAPLDRTRVGQKAYAIGNPRGLEVTLSDGLVSGMRRKEDGSLEAVQTTAPISAGSSGGGLFDSEGRLIGITTFMLRESQNLNFAVPSTWIAELAERGKANLQMKTASAAAAKPSPFFTAPAASWSPARAGDHFEYALTDRFAQTTTSVHFRVNRMEGERAIFNGGERVELNGGVVELNEAIAGELDMLTPPGGWSATAAGTATQLRFVCIAKTEIENQFRINAVPGAPTRITTAAGEFDVVPIHVTGWVQLRSRTYNASPIVSPYKATVWWSTELKRVVRLEAKSTVTNSAYLGRRLDQTIELIKVERQ